MDSRHFVVPTHDLDVAGRSVVFELPVSWLKEVLQDCEMQPSGASGSARLHIMKTGKDILVRGRVEVELVVGCARCLAPVHFQPEVELSLVLEPAASESLPSNVRKLRRTAGAKGPGPAAATAATHGRARGRQGKPAGHEPDPDPELDEDDADRDTYEGDEVVLDRFFREALLLESPIFPLCSETCEGIRPT